MTRLVLPALLLTCSLAAAYQTIKPGTFTDADKAGPDFVVQGEYEGKRGKEPFAAQIIARGEGKFDVVFLPGGLPGAGWDGKTRHKTTAKTTDGKTELSGDWSGTIADGKLTGRGPDGQTLTLAKGSRKSPNEGLKPPAGAVILFDGTRADEWKGGKLIEEKYLNPGVATNKTFRDFKLHIEFRAPYMPTYTGQRRGNSGVYLQQRYEIQVLDSFGLEGKPNECGGVYEKIPPKVNMCLPPLAWQTYDIDFKAARFDASGKKTANAVVTVDHNGVKVHDKVEILGPTGHGRKEEDTPGAIALQNHGCPMVFRNVWLVELKE